jgi:hypothetical protein
VNHAQAREWIARAPRHAGNEGWDCEDCARFAEDEARDASRKKKERFAFGLCKGKLRSSGLPHMVNLYMDPAEGACLMDNTGQRIPWDHFTLLESALIL